MITGVSRRCRDRDNGSSDKAGEGEFIQGNAAKGTNYKYKVIERGDLTDASNLVDSCMYPHTREYRFWPLMKDDVLAKQMRTWRRRITGDDNYLGESSILSICRFLENQNSTSSNNVLL
jgi:hypothetical protein